MALCCLFGAGSGAVLADSPAIDVQPGNSTNCAGGTATLSVTASGIDPLSYQWYLNATTAVAGATSGTLTFTSVQVSDAGNYTVVVSNDDGSGSTTSSPPALLVVNALPGVSVNSAAICTGDSAMLTAATDAANPSYLWSPDGQTTPSITVSPVSTTTYAVTVVNTNLDGTTCSSSAFGTVVVNPLTTASAPSDVTVCANASAIFSTTALGAGTLTYQWLKDGAALDATNSSTVLSNISAGDAGNYCVVVNGACDSATNCATLTVLPPVAITTQPSSLTVPVGSAASFAVEGSGTAPLSYQWQQDGSNLVGETNATLTIASAQSTNAGNYSALVTDACGSITSLVATLSESPAQPTQIILIRTNAVWKYLDDGTDESTSPGISWRVTRFDDTSWASGPAELGYGATPDGRPVNTTISYGPDPANKYITTYFRYTFVLTNIPALTNLTVSLQSLDGGVVYLNFAEVYRNLMPTGIVSFATLALPAAPPEPNEPFYSSRTINRSALNEGTNTLAVEMHLSAATNVNMSFGLKLTARYGQPRPIIPNLTRGPYLQIATPTGITVRWRTDLPTSSRIDFGLDPAGLTDSASDDEVTSEHIVSLAGLLPATKYYYAVGANGTNFAAGPDYFFTTAPSGPKPTRVWVIGDSGTAGLPGGKSEAVRDAYSAFAGTRDTDIWLMLGDNAYYDGTDEDYQTTVFDIYPQLLGRTVLWPTIGNHEVTDPDPNGNFAYFDIFSLPTRGEAGGVPSGTENYYSFDYGNIHFICLDSELSDRSTNGPMLTWLQADLASNTNDWLIAFWHSPPYTHGSHNSDDPSDSYGALMEMRERVVPILESYGVDLVLCGHSHDYERSFLLDGHYGVSSTLAPSMIKDSGSGRPEDTGAYLKSVNGPSPHQGAVYVVNGCSGWAIAGGTLDHPVMFKSLLQTGSLVLDVDGNRLDAKFLRETGAIDDSFTILKGVAPEPLRVASFLITTNVLSANWKSIAGKTYRLETTDSLGAGSWTDVSGPVTATGATTSWIGPIPSRDGSRFYRVVEIQN